MRSKKFLFFIIILFVVIFINTSCFATFDFTYNDEEYSFPDLPTDITYFTILRYYSNIYLFSIPDISTAYYNPNGNGSFDCDGIRYVLNGSSWSSQGSGSWGTSSAIILYSNYDIKYRNSDEIYFPDSTKVPEQEPEISKGIDTLYIGDIPTEFCYAQFNSDYVTLYNKSSATNEDLAYYRIYFIENYFTYDTGTIHFDNTVNFQKINVTNKFYYRRDFANICLVTFIIVIFFLWVTNLFTSLIYKGGILRGLW